LTGIRKLQSLVECKGLSRRTQGLLLNGLIAPTLPKHCLEIRKNKQQTVSEINTKRFSEIVFENIEK